MQRFAYLIKRFRTDERGVFLVIFALLAIVIIAASGAVVDFTRVQQSRTKAQIALDAAALALQATIDDTGVTAATLKVKAQALLTERMADSSVTAVVEAATPILADGKLTITGYISVPTYFVQLVGIKDIRSAMLSEVTRASNDLEVSLSIDITGSMAKEDCTDWDDPPDCEVTDKIGDLIKASNTLIDEIVSSTQPPTAPTYSKMAIVPWAPAVNVGTTYANAVRGTVTGGVSVSAVTWYQGTSKNLSAITRANPGVFTYTGTDTGLANGNWVYISGVSGMTQINGRTGTIASLNTTANTFRLNPGGGTTSLCTTNSTCGSWSAYTSGGTVRRCLLANCLEQVTTSSAHGIAAGESVFLTGTVGTTGVNNSSPNVWTPTILTTTTYSLPGTSPTNGIGTSGGTSYCVKYGCQYYRFANRWGGYDLHQPNTCVTDRTTNAYTDIAPSTSPLSKHYLDTSGSNCVTKQIVPLTSDKTALHTAIGPDSPLTARTLVANGGTGGHLGLAWGWYMIAPNFAYLWPTASQPAAYGSDNLIKAIVFMTDGLFNTSFCTGVVDWQINCNSPNGSSQSQAATICTNIKLAANETVLYVVGFDLDDDAATLLFLETCASPGKFYRADDGAALAAAFKSIAGDLSELRISK
ncbi:MAG: pilus assembly protein TadG-related protein [Devosia sp.]